MARPVRKPLLAAAIGVLALVAGAASATARPDSSPVAGATTLAAAADQQITVDDADQGTGLDVFDYTGSGWGHATNEGAPANPYDGTNSWTDHAGDAVSFQFVGTQLTFYGITAPQHGIGDVSIDGGAVTPVDFYSASRTGDVALWTSPTLSEGTHTFTLAFTGQKNPAASDYNVTVDRVVFTGQPLNTDIAVNPAGVGRTFDGFGAISGGGGNSRLLIDYPPKQRDQILDYLFKPGYGADLQILKLEIGGDANSTDGAEPSVEHSQGVVNCDAGYEFWLAEQAKARNPNIKLYGLAWAAPGWINNGSTFWSQQTVDYLMTWMGCAQSHGLNIDYLGGWNEKGYNATFFEELHAAIAQRQLKTLVVGADSGFDIADSMATDQAFNDSIDIVSAHYACEGGDGGNADQCYTSQNALNTGKPLWDSENGSQDYNAGAPALIRAFTRGYIDAKMTALLNWPLIAAITSNLPFPTTGLAVASQPWSGNYSIGLNTWVTAQVTQFTQPGWSFIDSASGYLAGGRGNGSYVTLVSPDKKNFSTVVETTTASAPSTATITLDKSLTGTPVQVWATNTNSTNPGDQFQHLGDVTTDQNGAFDYTLQPGYVYTFSTVTGASKGTATSPAAGTLALPYTNGFDQYTSGQEAKYLMDMQGAFEAQPCAANRPGMCLQQMAATKPIEWQQDSDAFTLVGDPSWSNYQINTKVEFAKASTVEIIGRAGTQSRPQSHQQGYYFQVGSTGAWTILKSDANGVRTTLAKGAVGALGTGSWHAMGLSMSGSTITGSIDGHDIATVQDASYTIGQAGLGVTSYVTDQFDDLAITPVGPAQAAPTAVVTPSSGQVQRGAQITVQATVSVPRNAAPLSGLNLTLETPTGFTYDNFPQVFGLVLPGGSATGTWTLTAPTDATSTANLTVVATYAQHDVASVLSASTSVKVVNPPPPTGTVNVSDLPFLSATNGWGPVERDESVGGNNPDDGNPITINGVHYAKGLGTNSISDVAIYLGGNCSSFTSDVGIDDETGGSGTVTFSVGGDGKTLTTTPVIRGHQAATPLTVDVSGVQVLDLIVGDAGDGNADDHGDWAAPTLHCAG